MVWGLCVSYRIRGLEAWAVGSFVGEGLVMMAGGGGCFVGERAN